MTTDKLFELIEDYLPIVVYNEKDEEKILLSKEQALEIKEIVKIIEDEEIEKPKERLQKIINELEDSFSDPELLGETLERDIFHYYYDLIIKNYKI